MYWLRFFLFISHALCWSIDFQTIYDEKTFEVCQKESRPQVRSRALLLPYGGSYLFECITCFHQIDSRSFSWAFEAAGVGHNLSLIRPDRNHIITQSGNLFCKSLTKNGTYYCLGRKDRKEPPIAYSVTLTDVFNVNSQLVLRDTNMTEHKSVLRKSLLPFYSIDYVKTNNSCNRCEKPGIRQVVYTCVISKNLSLENSKTIPHRWLELSQVLNQKLAFFANQLPCHDYSVPVKFYSKRRYSVLVKYEYCQVACGEQRASIRGKLDKLDSILAEMDISYSEYTLQVWAPFNGEVVISCYTPTDKPNINATFIWHKGSSVKNYHFLSYIEINNGDKYRIDFRGNLHIMKFTIEDQDLLYMCYDRKTRLTTYTVIPDGNFQASTLLETTGSLALFLTLLSICSNSISFEFGFGYCSLYVLIYCILITIQNISFQLEVLSKVE